MQLKKTLVEADIDHANIQNIGTNAHTAIDIHIAGVGASVHGDSFLLNNGDDTTSGRLTSAGLDLGDDISIRLGGLQDVAIDYDSGNNSLDFDLTGGTNVGMRIIADNNANAFVYDDSVGIGHFGYGAVPSIFRFVSYYASSNSNYPNTLARFDIIGTEITNVTAMSGQATATGGGQVTGMSFNAQHANDTNIGMAQIALDVENSYKYSESTTNTLGTTMSLNMGHILRGNWITGSTVLNVTEMLGIRQRGFIINYPDGDATINIDKVVGFQIEDSDLSTKGSTNPTITDQIGIFIQELTAGINNYGIVLEDNVTECFGTNKDARIYYNGNLIIDPNFIGAGKVYIGATGNDTINAGAYEVGGVAGINFSGAVTNITVVNGLVTAAS